MYTRFENISSEARVWIYILSEKLTKSKTQQLENNLVDICNLWKSHGKIITSTYLIYKNQFILFFAEEDEISGCSIDSTNNNLRKILNQLNINLDSNSKIGIFIDDKVVLNNRDSVIDLIKKKHINKSNKMINTTVINKRDYINNWILTIENSWLNNFI